MAAAGAAERVGVCLGELVVDVDVDVVVGCVDVVVGCVDVDVGCVDVDVVALSMFGK